MTYLLCLSVILFPCLFAADASPDQDVIVKETSHDWGIIVIDNYRLINNVWNRGAASDRFSQSVFLKERNEGRILGWQWNNPFSRDGAVVSYPEIVYGDKPWDQPSTQRTEFPILAGSRQIIVDFNVAIKARGVYNMAFSLWGTSSLPTSPRSITHEIMIWNINSSMTPAGERIGMMRTGEARFDVYMSRSHGDASGVHANQWNYIAFVSRKKMLRGPLNISDFIDYLLEKKILSPDNYITSLELGNEVVDGKGYVEIQDFAVTIK